MSATARQDPHGAAQLVEVVPQAATEVGSVVTARRGLRRDTAFVVGVVGEQAAVIWSTGETGQVSMKRLGTPVGRAAVDVKSVPGRLLRMLSSKESESYRTEAASATIQALIDDLLQLREHAIGFLLDRRPLSLSLADCLALPIEPWRVRYEFLRAPSGPESVDSIARDIVTDSSAPLGIRAVVALKYAIATGDYAPEVEMVFGGRVGRRDYAELSTAAATVAHALEAVGVRSASRLGLAVSNPLQLSASIASAAVLSARERPAPVGKRLQIEPGTPLPVVDDLIDRGAPVEVSPDASESPVNDVGVPVAAYVLARTDPTRLRTEQVVALRFEAEAARRYLSGDFAVEPALARDIADDLKQLRTVITGDMNEIGDARNPIVLELRDVLGSGGQRPPSETLLADRSVWGVLIDAGVTGSSDTGPLGTEFAGLSALIRAEAALLEWRWDEARTIARGGLREARREAVRDELLNITACSLWLQGDPEPALAALDNALEGEYSDALLINASVVATALEHASAVERLVKIAREAPSPHQRAVAAERALVMWLNDDARIWEGDEDEDSLPTDIRDALRPLLREKLPDDRYQRILRVLASRDDEWLAAQPNTAFGLNTGRASTRIFRARAKGIDTYIQAMASLLRAGNVEPWLLSERDSVVDAAIEVLLERNDELAAAFFGLTVVDSDLPMAGAQRVALKCLTVASIAASIDHNESEPKERFIDFVADAHAELKSLESNDRDRLSGLVTIAAERLARSYFGFRYNEFHEAIDAYNTMMASISSIPARNLNRHALGEAMAPISHFCSDTWTILNRLRPLLEDVDLIDAVQSMMSQASDIGHRIAAVTR